MSQQRILVIDNVETTHCAVAACLKAAGYHVDLSTNSTLVGKHLAEDNYDMVLVEMEMLRMYGISVLEGCRTMRTGPPVFMMATHCPISPNGLTPMVQQLLSCLAPSTDAAVSTFKQHLDEARLLLRKGDLIEATHSLHAALTLTTLKPEPYNLLGCIEELSHHRSAAQKLYRAALSMDPSYSAATHNLNRLSEMFHPFQEPIDLGEEHTEL